MDCADIIRQSVREGMSDEEIIRIYDRVKKMRQELARKADKAGDIAAELQRKATEEGDLRLDEALARKRAAILQASAQLRIESSIAANWRGKEYEGLSSVIVGTQHARAGARRSVDAAQQSLAGYYTGGFLSDLERLDGPHYQIWRKGTMDSEISEALWTIDNPAASPYKGPKEAMEIAEVIHKWQEIARSDGNRAGAWTGKMPGYVVRQSHDALKLRSKGFEAWRDAISPRLDWERTANGIFRDADSAVVDGKTLTKESYLREIFMNLRTGVRLDGSRIDPPKAARRKDYGGTVASRMSQERVLHFLDGKSWFEYNKIFGIGTLQDAVFQGLQRSAQGTALMRAMGPNPRATLDTVYNRLELRLRQEGRAEELDRLLNKRHALDAQLAEVDGSLNAVGNPTAAQIFRVIRGLQSMSKLGGAVISAFGDVPVFSSEFSYQGMGRYEAMWRGITLALRGRGTAEQRAILSQIGVFSDSMAGDLAANFSGDDIPGSITRMQTLFFKMTGLTWWTDSWRKAAGLMMSHELALERALGWDALSAERRRVFSLYGIDAKRWDIMRSAGTRMADGREYLTPDGLDAVSDDAFEALLRAEGRDVSPEAIADLRWEMADQLRTYFRDRISYAVLEPDAKTRSILRQGTSSGTFVGEALRCVMQFKSFSIATIQKVWGRETLGRGNDSVRAALSNRHGEILSIAQLVLTMGAFGYLSMTTKELLKGRNPRKWWESPEMAGKTFMAALAQGGGLGIFGDFLFGESNRYGGGLIASMAGPTAGTIEDIHKIYTRIREGDTLGQGALRTAMGLVPGSNIWYFRGAFDYFLGYRLYEAINPGYFERMQRRVERENNQTFWMRPQGT